jgi:nucleotide-binding universal stress UspA family protein
MPIKVVFVPLADSEGAQSIIGAAMGIAASLGAEVDVAHLGGDPTRALGDLVGEAVSPQLIEEVLAQAEKRAKASAQASRKAYDAAVAKAKGVKSRYQEIQAAVDVAIEDRGRFADLIVVRRATSAKDVGVRVVAEVALMSTARPVLVVPSKSPAGIGSNVAIAWNDSLESSKAVAAALPFITRASKVTVISANDGGTINQKAILAYLGRHGVKAKGVSVKAGADAGKAIAAAASKAGANLLVMGAYSHSRVRELIFGGVTEHALASARLPVLMVH